MRRPNGGCAHTKSAMSRPSVGAAEEEARIKQKEDVYAAARLRIFGEDAPPPAAAPSSEASPPPPPPPPPPPHGSGEVEGAPADAARPDASKSVTNSVSQRAQDALDPDYSRGAVRWAPVAPVAPPQLPVQYPCAMSCAYGEPSTHATGYLGGPPRARYSQGAGWGGQPQAPSMPVGARMPMSMCADSSMAALHGRPAARMQQARMGRSWTWAACGCVLHSCSVYIPALTEGVCGRSLAGGAGGADGRARAARRGARPARLKHRVCRGNVVLFVTTCCCCHPPRREQSRPSHARRSARA